MFRLLVCYETPADPQEFDRHYREVHIPLAMALPGLRRYTVSREAIFVRGANPYYLVAELDWDDRPALDAAFASPQGRATAADVTAMAPTGVRSVTFELEPLL